ncbi:DNA (cytosine-5-)-methyltransferase [Actinomadura rupiterrae]|uniref:DNA (cytosine-5-)-methyltransferase n=1 Tax=Actinomadura rupiterrae TaxID=559627 RepID=UPI0020A33D6E|nr:DNA (cytosine-5-)-methyltransferase [Actinomadura rupiterrae]MCP2337478.1 DNA (cytosine-5)-methyltransferase 1 [Actinomadura rupiterrae]
MSQTGYLRVGSLCTGYGGLDLAVHAVVAGAELVWCADNDRHVGTLLATRWPDVPNLGDLIDVDWATVPSVDLVTAGFPCQDISFAGRGAGIRKDTRSGLWIIIADAVRLLRPRYVFLENVAALRSRGLDTVLGDLAALGYDTAWMCLRASDVGAPHQRDRIFILAAHPDSPGPRTPEPGPAQGLRTAVPPGRRGQLPAVADPGGVQRQRHRAPGILAGPRSQAAAEPGNAAQHRRPVAADAQGGRRDALKPEQPPLQRGLDAARGGAPDWCDYESAVRSWENLLGRPAPCPTEPGRNGRPRLNARFVEWMMGLPDGHVTDLPLPRGAQMRILGNGVVPQQAAAAFLLLDTALNTEGRH